MRRRATDFLCALSLLIFATGSMLWVRSYFAQANIFYIGVTEIQRGPHQSTSSSWGFAITWSRGFLSIGRFRNGGATSSRFDSGWHYERWTNPVPPDLNVPPNSGDRLNVRVGNFQVLNTIRSTPGGWRSYQHIVFPLWFSIAAAIPPVLWWRRHRRQAARGFHVTIANADLPTQSKIKN